MIKRLLFVLVFVPCLLWIIHDRALAQTPDSACKLCHIGNTAEITLPSGETMPVDVAPAVLNDSVHGVHTAESVYCTDCHQNGDRYRYPHEPMSVQSLAEFAAAVSQNCENCHTPLELHNPGHLLAADTADLPNCVDCHGGHDVPPVTQMKENPVATCQSCHGEFDNLKLASMHKQVVANLGPDQTCQTCHADTPPPTADATCKTCHALLSEPVLLRSGERIDPHVDPATIHDSVHGPQELNGQPYGPLQCTECHTSMANTTFPHKPLTVDTQRELTVRSADLCADCHENIVAQHADSIHAEAMARGDLDAATCIDCHGSHNIQPPNEPRERISQTCGNCHDEIEAQYATSVHGEALIGENNPDVPVCTNCHGVHQIPDPTTAIFRINSPQMCGECHADTALMAKYDISTDVFETYVADFHGTTVTLFEQQSPEEESNKAVCYDCHGIHDILPPTDEHSSVIKQNLLETCRNCHPDANENFPDSWTSHFKPSLQHNPVVYLVNLFYDFLIPTVVGGFALFIGSDVFRRTWNRRRHGRKHHE